MMILTLNLIQNFFFVDGTTNTYYRSNILQKEQQNNEVMLPVLEHIK